MIGDPRAYHGIYLALLFAGEEHVSRSIIMEVRFRPMSASTIARQIRPGQASADEGQSFMEVVESLDAAEQAPGANPDSGRNQEQPHNPLPSVGPDSDTGPEEETPGQPADPAPDKSTAMSSDGSASQQKPLGVRLDLTA